MSLAAAPAIEGSGTGIARLAEVLVVLMVLSVPLEGLIVVPGLGSLTVIVGILTGLCAMLYVLTGAGLRPIAAEHCSLALFVLFSGFAIAWSENATQSVFRFISYAQLWIFAWLIWQFAQTQPALERLLKSYVAGSVIVALLLVHAVLTFDIESVGGGEIRISAFGINPNEQALGLAIAVPMSAYLITRSHGFVRTAFVFSIPALAVGVIITLSRGAFLSLAMALVASLIILRNGGEKRVAWGYVFATFGAVAIVLSMGVDKIIARILQLFSMIARGDLNSREIIWRVGLEHLPDSFFFGVGPGAYSAVTGSELSEPVSAHNTYLSIFVETGAIGFVLFFAPVILILTKLHRSSRTVRNLLWGIAIPLGLGVLITQWDYRKPFWFVLAIGIGLIAAQNITRQRQGGST